MASREQTVAAESVETSFGNALTRSNAVLAPPLTTGRMSHTMTTRMRHSYETSCLLQVLTTDAAVAVESVETSFEKASTRSNAVLAPPPTTGRTTTRTRHSYETSWSLQGLTTDAVAACGFNEVTELAYLLSQSVGQAPGDVHQLVILNSVDDGMWCGYGDGPAAA
jgi:hypothetical protein